MFPNEIKLNDLTEIELQFPDDTITDGHTAYKRQKQVGDRKYHAQPVVYFSIVSNCAWNWTVLQGFVFSTEVPPLKHRNPYECKL